MNESYLFLPNGTNATSILTPRAIVYPLLGGTISLDFIWLGPPIPPDKVEKALDEALSQIEPWLGRHATDQIPDKRFLFHEYAGKSEIVVDILALGQMSWVEVYLIILGIFQFTKGVEVVDRSQHFRNLEFKIKGKDDGLIGSGNLLQLFGADSVSSRISKPSAPPQPLNEFLSQPFNPSDGGGLGTAVFPVPDTEITLRFVQYGEPLSPTNIQRTLNGALRDVEPSTRQREDERVPGDEYSYRGEMVGIMVMALMSWSQLDSIVDGLNQFVHGVGTAERAHFQELLFDIYVANMGGIGTGGLLSIVQQQGGSHVEKRMNAISQQIDNTTFPLLPLLRTVNGSGLQPSTAIPSSSNLNTLSAAINWPVEGTDMALSFTHVGDPLPPEDVNSAISSARTRIAPSVEKSPNHSIGERGFRHQSGYVAISVEAYEGCEMTWRELGDVLLGLSQFCGAAYKHVLVWQVEVVTLGGIAAGQMQYYEPGVSEAARGSE